jgi:hypothetical protein
MSGQRLCISSYPTDAWVGFVLVFCEAYRKGIKVVFITMAFRDSLSRWNSRMASRKR